jgi:outer membrane protein TolC
MRRKKRNAAQLARSFGSKLCLAGLSLTPLACASYGDSVPPSVAAPRMPLVRAITPAQDIQLVKADGPDGAARLPDSVLPAPKELAAPAHPVALSLATIFRLAEDQNAQIAISRARIDAAYASKDLADKAWLPQISFGSAWFRHEGGIANQDGTLQNSSFGSLLAGGSLTGKFDFKDVVYQQFVAERDLWQKKGEFKKVTTETLLDASNTYVDLLAARSGEALALEGKKQLEDLLEKAQKAATATPAAGGEVARIKSTLRAREMLIMQMQQDAARASAKLVYLLGIDPCSTIAVVDDHLVPLDLVDPARPVCDLVQMAMSNGPGVQEMERILALIEEGASRANGPAKYMPIVEMNMIEGGFGTGPGASTSWNNRMDLFLQVRWDLSQLLTQNERQRLLRARTEEAHLTDKDLRAKLTSGVQEAWEIVTRGREALRLGEEAIAESKNAEKLSQDRLNARVANVTYSEIMQGEQMTASARASYLSALRNYNQAQLRLFLLTGSLAPTGPASHNCATGACHPE